MERIRQAACRDKQLRFTTLWHHVYDIEHLRGVYFSLKRDAAPGVDGETWRHYGEQLEENLKELSGRLKRGAYRAKPVKRAYIPKPDGRQRPLGVTTLEDKIVQRATVEVLNATYSEEGVPQGGSVSPMLANVYLHYVFDLWVEWWRRRHAAGDVIVVRFCDDFVVGFQHHQDAVGFLEALNKRLCKFNLNLHEDKTRLIEFGRFAAQNRKRQGKGKPETFDFLGFTHICGKTRKGKFAVLRYTIAKRMRAKLMEIKGELRRRLHWPVPIVGKWLRVVLLGHYRYYGVPGNFRKIGAFKYHLSLLWFRTLRRRSQRHRLIWERMSRLINRWLPRPRICHRYPDLSLYVKT